MKTMFDQLKGIDALIAEAMGGASVHLHPIPGDVPVVQITIDGRQELPVYLTSSDAQILCMCYLWGDDEVRPERRTELLETLLDLNLSVPLSSFGRVDKRYVLFGALSVESRVEDIAKDVAVLSDNAVDALDALSEFLN